MKSILATGIILFSLFIPNANIVGSWIIQAGSRSYTIIFDSDNTYAIDFGSDGSKEVTGTYSFADGKMTMKDISGPMKCERDSGGMYRVSINGNEATFTLISDNCKGRKGLNGATLKRK